MTFTTTLATFLKSHAITKAAFCKALGIKATNFSKLTNPQQETEIRIIQALNELTGKEVVFEISKKGVEILEKECEHPCTRFQDKLVIARNALNDIVKHSEQVEFNTQGFIASDALDALDKAR